MKNIVTNKSTLLLIAFYITGFLNTFVIAEEPKEADTSEVKLSPSQIKLAEIKTVPVSIEGMATELILTGEVGLNKEDLVHIVPILSGVTQKVNKKLGDHVKAGELLTKVISRELADGKADYLVANTRVTLAQTNFVREKELWGKKINSEKEFLNAKQVLAEARISLLTASQKLYSFGFTKKYLEKSILKESDESRSTYNILSPIDGTIIYKRIAQGEKVADAEIYILSNLNLVWVICSVYEKDIAKIKINQQADFSVTAYPNQTFSGKVTWISPTIDERSRTMKIRLEVTNKEGLLKPGMFAKVALGIKVKPDVITVPRSAIQTQKGESIVFVAYPDGRFLRREVKLGSRTTFKQEVISGLKVGERVVSNGSFIIKSELGKASMDAD